MNLDKFKNTIRSGVDRRWTLLFIGDNGNVVTLKRFKAIIAAAGCLFCLAFVCVAVLFFSNQKILKENKDLQKRSQNSQQQIETLRHEKEILMARLVIAESRAKDIVAENRLSPKSATAAKPAIAQPRAVAKSKLVPERQKEPPVHQARRSQPLNNQTLDAEAVMRVAVENFKVSRESDNANLMAQFKIKNTSQGYQRVAGNAVVVLKGADLEKKQWLVMPLQDLAGNKPAGKRGKSFSIKRFLTMNFTTRAPNYSDQFQTAAVYVFSKSGKLLLEQDFAIKLPPLPVVSKEPPAEDTSPREAQPAETSTRQPDARQKPPQEPAVRQKPPQEPPASAPTPGEVPAVDDVLDSLDDAPPVY